MKEIFVDTGYWIAQLNPKDELHQRAQEVASGLGRVRYVTSEWVLTELLNGLAGRGTSLRQRGAELIMTLRKRSDMAVIPATSDVFRAGVQLYAGRPDKAWGLTDCTSFLIMRSRGIQEALAHDHHFQQAGFVPLLRNE
jgi:predicted nucleic acid-binding protein